MDNCTKCGQPRYVTATKTYRLCEPCQKAEWRRRDKERNAKMLGGERVCSRCRETFPATLKYFGKRGDGLQAYCRPCHAAITAANKQAKAPKTLRVGADAPVRKYKPRKVGKPVKRVVVDCRAQVVRQVKGYEERVTPFADFAAGYPDDRTLMLLRMLGYRVRVIAE